jgi:hypothetical protein
MFTRCLTERLQRLLGVMPAVYLQGARSLPMGEGLWAVPITALWSEPL